MHELPLTDGLAEEFIKKVKEDEKQAEKHYRDKKEKESVPKKHAE